MHFTESSGHGAKASWRNPRATNSEASWRDGTSDMMLQVNVSFRRRSGSRRVFDELVGPRDEVLQVRPVFVPAIVLTPGKFALEQAGVDRRHFCRAIIFFYAKVSRTQESEDRAGGDCGHVAALLVEPVGVAAFRDAVADESGTRRTQPNHL